MANKTCRRRNADILVRAFHHGLSTGAQGCPRSFRWLFGLILLACLAGNPPAADAAVQRPDILMIAIDDLRPMLGCYGDPRAKTPNIDRLAKRGVLFERAYCQYAKCGVSRLSIMSGLRPDAIDAFAGHRRKYADAFRARRPDAIPMGQWFKQNGYHTRSLGKIYHDGWDLAANWSEPAFPGREAEMLEIHDESNPDGPTIIAERWDCPVMQSPDVPDEHFFAGRMTTEVLRILRERDGESPLFLAVGYRRPHLPFIAPKKYFDLHQPDESWLARNPEPPIGSPVMAWFNGSGYAGGARNHLGLRMPNPPSRAEAPHWNGYEMRSYRGAPSQGRIDSATQLKLIQAYAACVSYVDAQIGKLLVELEQSGRLENTVVVLWADHGWHLGEHSAWSKMTNFEIATRVPFIIAAPGVDSARTQNLAELVDLYPTLCELAGVKPPKHVEGESLVPVLKEPAKSITRQALSQHERHREKYMGRALRTDNHRYVAWFEKKSGRVVERELYDHRIDPLETRNIADAQEQAALVKRLHRQLVASFKLR
jgi:iduronate 2-sulfatase